MNLNDKTSLKTSWGTNYVDSTHCTVYHCYPNFSLLAKITIPPAVFNCYNLLQVCNRIITFVCTAVVCICICSAKEYYALATSKLRNIIPDEIYKLRATKLGFNSL